MQRSGTEAIRTQIQRSKPKLKITNITISQNTKRTYGQPSEQLFPKRWPLSNRNRTKSNINTHKSSASRWVPNNLCVLVTFVSFWFFNVEFAVPFHMLGRVVVFYVLLSEQYRGIWIKGNKIAIQLEE